jgi:hypothetical protein
MPPTAAQMTDWRKRLMRLVDEVENAYGPPGDSNQDPLDMAVHLAFYIACDRCRAAGLQ